MDDAKIDDPHLDAPAEGRLLDEKGRLPAQAKSTCLLSPFAG